MDTNNTSKDPELWELAKKRVGFRYHFTMYVVLNVFFWSLWYFSGRHSSHGSGLPWPVWPMFGWGIGLLFHFINAYVFPGNNLTEREYQKLKSKQV